MEANVVQRPNHQRIASGMRSGLRRVADALASPRLAADYLDMFHPLRADAELRARVVGVRPETADVVTVVLRPGDGWRGHVPGQYVRVGVDVDGVRLWRSYSITSPPDAVDGLLTITAKAIPGGVVSQHFLRDLNPGQLVHLDQARGDFVLPDPVPEKILFITGGSGITPVMGMLRAGWDRFDDVVMVHSDRTPADVIFGAELRSMGASGCVRLIERHTDSQGLLDVAGLAELVDDLPEREAFVCGPAGLIDAVEQVWSNAGLTDRLHLERFRAPLRPTGEGGTVQFTRTEADVATDGGTTILDAGEQAGVLMPSGCRMGICFSCVLPLQSGSVRDLRTGEVTTATDGDPLLIQTCVSAPAGPCQVEA